MHCSAGVGRTGTFIGTYAVLSSLHGIRKDKYSFLLPLLVREMRKQRICMVQSQAQYEFLYKSVLISTDEVRLETAETKMATLVDRGASVSAPYFMHPRAHPACYSVHACGTCQPFDRAYCVTEQAAAHQKVGSCPPCRGGSQGPQEPSRAGGGVRRRKPAGFGAPPAAIDLRCNSW